MSQPRLVQFATLSFAYFAALGLFAPYASLWFSALGFSTIGQMGYMIMECGLGAFALAVFHLIAHGLFKATAFLNCGHVIHQVRQEPHLPHTRHAVEERELSRLAWATGFAATLVLPLIILLATHGVLAADRLQASLEDLRGARQVGRLRGRGCRRGCGRWRGWWR